MESVHTFKFGTRISNVETRIHDNEVLFKMDDIDNILDMENIENYIKLHQIHRYVNNEESIYISELGINKLLTKCDFNTSLLYDEFQSWAYKTSRKITKAINDQAMKRFQKTMLDMCQKMCDEFEKQQPNTFTKLEIGTEMINQHEEISNEIQEVQSINSTVEETIEEQTHIVNQHIPDQITRAVNRGSKYQIYNMEKQLVHTFNNLKAATEKSEYFSMGASKCQIFSAVNLKNTYKGYIWIAIDRNIPDDQVQEIPEISTRKECNVGEMVAVLNARLSIVEAVFCDMKATVEAPGGYYSSIGGLAKAIDKKISDRNGNTYMLWNNVNEEMQNEYLSEHQLPRKRIRANAKPMAIVFPTNGLIKEVCSCEEDVISAYPMSRITLHNIVKNKTISRSLRFVPISIEEYYNVELTTLDLANR